jgi:biopolymer transport protein ExbD
MSKVKMHRSTPSIDMTPMVDLAFLLVTFFMLTATATPDEPVQVSIPSSVSEMPIPESNMIVITISKDNKVFFTIDGQGTRSAMLEKVAAEYNLSFTPDETHDFAVLTSFGLPVTSLKSFLALDREERKQVEQPGIPVDSLNNQLKNWILQARIASGNRARIAIKGDADSQYPTLKKVINTLLDCKVNRFNFITSDEQIPADMKVAASTPQKH